MIRGISTLLVCGLLANPRAALAQTQAHLDSAVVAWDVGHYVEALERLERLLGMPGGERFVEAVALLTGELYQTIEVAPNGASPRWSPDGRFAAFEIPGDNVVTELVRFDAGGVRRVATLPGRGLVFAPSGREAAYLALTDTAALVEPRAAVRRALEARDIPTFRRLATELQRLEEERSRVRVRDLTNGRERDVEVPGLRKQALAYAWDERTLLLVGSGADQTRSDIYALAVRAAPRALTDGPGLKTSPVAAVSGALVYSPGGGRIAIRDSAGTVRTFDGTTFTLSADRSTLAWVGRDGDANTLSVLSLRGAGGPAVIKRARERLGGPGLSPDGSRIAYQMMPREDWEVYVAASDGSGERRITTEIQHDLFPRFLTADRLLSVMGEARHRRSYIYDVATGARTRLFHNNQVRTVSMEYAWSPSPDGTRLLIVADRDGNTISPERGVYLTDLTRRVTRDEVMARIRSSLVRERELQERGRRAFAPIADQVRATVADVTASRIYGYAQDLYRFGSKYITQPGNALAIEYLERTLRSWGYEPEVQWFEPQGRRTANVIATLRGTSNPNLIYVVSSHFDSVEGGPGSDDNTSGSTALLEAARVMAGRPQAATIKFAWFTGEEAGLLGSREFVRRAVAAGDRIVGALNNDMLGWMNDHHLDNTIRYSNDGIRDLQHAAAFLFSELVTYDSRYYQSTDAHAYYEAYGDIVGGIGSYPILGNPHYHQPHDVLETISQRLVAEVSKTTVASVMILASSPSRLAGLQATRRESAVEVSWTPAAEAGVTSYLVAAGPAADPLRRTVTVTDARASLSGVERGAVVSVKAVGTGGLESWDWARVTVP
jgi:Tol biopolymer transport system component